MFLLFDIGEFFQKALIAINVGIYKLVGYIYQIFLTLAETNLFSEAEYHRLVDKIYIVLGVVVLFIIAYNILTYIVDPDKDKNFTASGKLIKNIVVTFIMIAVCPFLFSFAYGIQGAILNGDLIFGFFDTGSGATETSSGMNIRNGGIRMAADTFFTFFDPLGDKTQVNQSNGKTYNHSTTYKCLSDYSAKDECFKRWGLPNEGCTYNGSSITCNYSIKCSKGDCNFQEMRNYVQNTGSFAPVNAFAKNVSEGQIEYDWLLALICGAFLGYMIISFCFDLAVRIAKLTFYQIIAPLTIACRILPSQDKIYKNWFSAVKNTYFMVFIRVFVMALGIYLINQFETNFLNVFFSEGTVNNGSSLGIRQFAFVFVILGILTFLQQAPKLVEEIFGIKDVKLGIRDKLKESGATRLASGVAGMATAGVRNATAAKANKKGFWKGAASTIAGATSGLRRGFVAGKDAKTWREMINAGEKGAQGATSAREGREAQMRRYKADGKNAFTGRLSDAGTQIKQWATGGASQFDSVIKVSNDIKSKKDAMDNEAKKLIAKYASDEDLLSDIDSSRFKTAATVKIHEDLLRKTGGKISYDAVNQMLKTMQESSVDRSMYYKRDENGNIIRDSFDQTAYDAAVAKNAQDVSNMRSYVAQLEKELMLSIEDHAIRGVQYGSIKVEKLKPIEARASEMVQLFQQYGGQVHDSYTNEDFTMVDYRKEFDKTDDELKKSNTAHYLDKISGAYDSVRSEASAEQAKIMQNAQARKDEKGDKK